MILKPVSLTVLVYKHSTAFATSITSQTINLLQSVDMENYTTHKTNLALFFFFSYAVFVQALAPAGTIERVTKQQLLASIPPSHETTPTGSSQLFLTSPAGKYSVYLLRRETTIGAGGFGSDFCYVQVQDAGESVWESECTTVSNVNTCSLVFSDAGLEIFDGSRSAWDTDVEDDDAHIETLVLMDTGDMQIRNKDGDLKWRASDNPIVNQNCGSIGAPGLTPAHPPFASPIHGGKGPFGQENQGQQLSSPALGLPQQPADQGQQLGVGQQNLNQPFSNAVNQPFGVGGTQQPLVDNTPFDSGSSKVKMGLVCLVGLMLCFSSLF
ncbi:Glutamyl-tRNA(Gln) amidotransferase subunit A protein [Thalictrum thalictroides]|uniref:Glutamyl-tRNA(Gln) amidotransferase subunit A protein n=1 Tax=Thalictrum thalictroides TaxID=46969 RepID=A0A7J6WM98_THATH|nr:Glutamyl-tRNA(Gln) amidotransferase subunit A protein [Thalictrum thalictroides]